jgi:flagellar basal-body rod protein FlgC
MTDAMKGLFRGFDIAASGIHAEMKRQEIVSSNLVNMHRTGNHEHEPYRRRIAVFEELIDSELEKRTGYGGAGVTISSVVEDQTAFPAYHNPGDPMADESGMVLGSNVDLFRELADMQIIARSVDANLAAMRTYRGMLQSVVQNMGK